MALDYLLNPIDSEDIVAAVNKVMRTTGPPSSEQLIQANEIVACRTLKEVEEQLGVILVFCSGAPFLSDKSQ